MAQYFFYNTLKKLLQPSFFCGSLAQKDCPGITAAKNRAKTWLCYEKCFKVLLSSPWYPVQYRSGYPLWYRRFSERFHRFRHC